MKIPNFSRQRLPKEGVPIRNEHGYYKYKVTHLDGRVEELFCNLHTVCGKIWLEPYYGTYQNWIVRFNAWENKPRAATCYDDVIDMIGKDKWKEYKEWWITNHCIEVKRKYELLRDLSLKNMAQQLNMETRKKNADGSWQDWRESTKSVIVKKKK